MVGSAIPSAFIMIETHHCSRPKVKSIVVEWKVLIRVGIDIAMTSDTG
jgi:hypothetical protein